MRHAILITTHNNEEITQPLLKAYDDENIDFYISDGVIEGTYEESDDIFPESPTNRTINFSRYGYRIEDASQTDSSGSVNSLKSTLGAIAQYKNDKSSYLFITTGHGTEKNDDMYINDVDMNKNQIRCYIGKIVKQPNWGGNSNYWSGNVDISIIEKSDSSSVVPLNELRDGTDIVGSTSPVKGKVGKIAGNSGDLTV